MKPVPAGVALLGAIFAGNIEVHQDSALMAARVATQQEKCSALLKAESNQDQPIPVD